MAKGYLYVKVDKAEGGKFAQEIEANLPKSWRRATDWESRLKGQDGETEWYIYQDAVAGVCISRSDSETLQVTKIVPLEASELSDTEYNAKQREFQAIVQQTGFPSYISGEEAEIIVTKRARKALETFSSMANKATGSSNPLDLERWADFLVIAHEEKCFPDSGGLAQYLEEKLGWSGEKAHELAGESELAKVLLNRARNGAKG